MNPNNFESFFNIAISMLPTLFLLSKPTIIDSIKSHDGVTETPYKCFIETSKLFIWTLQELLKVNENDDKNMAAKLSLLLVRVCRASIDCIDISLTNCITWRNNQENLKTDDDMDDDHDLYSVELLEDALEWALGASQVIIQYAESVKTFLVLGDNVSVPKSLARTLPQLQLLAERLGGRIYRNARSHSIELNDKFKVRTVIWDEELSPLVSKFLSFHEKALETSAPLDSWTPITLNILDSHNEDMYNNNDAYPNDDDDEDEDEEENHFAAVTSNERRNSGWGLYGQDDVDDDFDDN
jgi:hypothetical protein